MVPWFIRRVLDGWATPRLYRAGRLLLIVRSPRICRHESPWVARRSTYSSDNDVFSFFNAATVAWVELNVAAIGGGFQNLNDVDFTTPPTDGQIFEWMRAGKLIPVDKPLALTAEGVQDILGFSVQRRRNHRQLQRRRGTLEIISNVTQYTDENAMDIVAAMLRWDSYWVLGQSMTTRPTRFRLRNWTPCRVYPRYHLRLRHHGLSG